MMAEVDELANGDMGGDRDGVHVGPQQIDVRSSHSPDCCNGQGKHKQTNKHIHTGPPPSLTLIQSGLPQGAQSDEGSREEEGEEEESDDDNLVEEELRRQDEVGDPFRTIPQPEIEAEPMRQVSPDIPTRKQE